MWLDMYLDANGDKFWADGTPYAPTFPLDLDMGRGDPEPCFGFIYGEIRNERCDGSEAIICVK